MNKVELAEKIASQVGIIKSQAEKVLDAFVAITIQTLKQGGEVTLTGFGAFSARKRKGREGINPRDPSKKINIPSVVVAKFKAGKNLKDELKKGDNQPVKPAEPAPTTSPTVSQ